MGAPRKDVGGDADQGAVYTFTRTGGDRNETAKLTDSGGNAFDDLGGSVAVDGDTIVAGSQGYNVAAEENHGAVLTFARTGGDRSQTAKLTSSDHTDFGVFGAAVAIDGNTIVVGASEAKPGSGDEAGAAYTFSRAGGDRQESGGSGNDRVSGNAGRDRVFGRAGNDRLWGRSGNDRLAGGFGRDRLDGGSGRNRLSQ